MHKVHVDVVSLSVEKTKYNIFCVLFNSLQFVGTEEVGPLQMSLVLEQNGMKAGNDFWIGWQIVRNPGWHTYWEHPGDVGVPPKLEWDLPEGFSVSPMQYARLKR